MATSQHVAGMRIGPFVLEAWLGSGGMGTVWAARHENAGGKPVALKFLLGRLLGRPEARQRLLREARVSQLIEHPAIVPVREVLELEGSLVLVMDLLEGETLRARLTREGSLAPPTAVAWLAEVASALSTAHAAGVVHRDLKPENIFLSREPNHDEVVKVLDFGVAKLLGAAPNSGDVRTELGSLLGTVAYMAPEQVLAAAAVDASVDVWALGVVLYEALAGCRPIEGSDQNDAIRRLLTEAIAPIQTLAPDLPEGLADLAGRMLSRSPEQRPSSAEVDGTLSRMARGFGNASSG